MSQTTVGLPQFSVIVPAFNAARYLPRALDSVRTQTSSTYEVIVVNDGSTDSTATVLVEYQKAHGTFPLIAINQVNGGVGAARNAAMRAARGEWLAFLDADDRWLPRKLEEVSQYIAAHPRKNIVYHGGVEVWPDGRASVMRRRQLCQPYYENLLLGSNPISPSATVMQRTLALQLGGFWERAMATGLSDNMDISDDMEFWLRLARAGADFGYFPAILEEYHRVDDSLTTRINYHGDRSLVVFQKHLQWIKENRRHGRWWCAYYERWRLAHNKLGRAFLFARGGDLPRALAAQREAIRSAWWWWKPYVNYFRIARVNLGGVARLLGARTLVGVLFRPWRAAKALRRSSSRAPVCLTFHDVPPEDLGQFRKLVEFLCRNYEVVDYETFCARLLNPARQGRTPVLITFDDGFASSGAAIKEVLEPMGIRAVLFVPTDYVDAATPQRRFALLRDGIFAGRRDVSEDVERFAPLSWEELKAFARRGHVIGAHTKTHRRLSALVSDELREEVIGSGRVIEQRLGEKPRVFAVPFGSIQSVSAEALALCANTYETTFTSVRGSNAQAAWHGLHRETVEPTDPPAYVGFMIEGGLWRRYRAAAARLAALGPTRGATGVRG